MKLRGHHLLCLHGFRGIGYSPEFVSNMWIVHRKLLSSPNTEVEVAASPDDICSACPHLADNRCMHGEEEREARTREKDALVLQRLSLSPGDKMRAGDLFALVVERFNEGIEDVCSSCKWFPEGWCADGIKRRAMVLEPLKVDLFPPAYGKRPKQK